MRMTSLWPDDVNSRRKKPTEKPSRNKWKTRIKKMTAIVFTWTKRI